MSMQNDQEFLEHVIKALVDHPEDVKVERQVDEMGVLLTLDVNPAEYGEGGLAAQATQQKQFAFSFVWWV